MQAQRSSVSPDCDPSRSRQAIRVAFAGMLMLAAAMGIGRFAYTPLLPPMMDALHWTISQAGDVASANFLGYVIGALLASVLVQRADRLRWLVAGMLFSTATTAAGAWVTSFAVWLGIRFVSGVASAFCLVLGTTVVVECLLRNSRTQLGALHFAGVGVGIVVSVLTVETVRGLGFTVFAQWGALGLVAGGMLLTSWLMVRGVERKPAAEVQSTAPDAPSRVRRPKRLTRLVAAYGLFGFGYVVTATFIVSMARTLDNAALLEPLTWIVVGLCGAPSILIWQRLALRHGIFAVLRIAYAIEATGVLLAGFGTGPTLVLIGGALLGGTFMGITALGLSAARQIAGRDQNRAIGWMTAAFGLGQLLGPAVAGRVAELTGGFGAPSMIAALLLIIGIVLLLGEEPAGA